MTVEMKWEGDAKKSAIDRALQDGLDDAAMILNTAIKTKLSRLGKFKSLGKQASQADRDFVNEQGFVDPPGGSPRLRTGALRRSINTVRDGKTSRLVGVFGNLKYAAIHEFGGKINNPGGQPYIVVGNKATGKPTAVFLSKMSSFTPGKRPRQQRRGATLAKAIINGAKIKFTKAHTIDMPSRPYIRPAFDQSRDKMIDAMLIRMRKEVGGE